MSNINNDCNIYKFSIKDLFFPPIDIFNLLCSHIDKTLLFIYSFFRIIVIIFIIILIYKFNYPYNFSIILLNCMIFYLILNCVILYFIIYKKPLKFIN